MSAALSLPYCPAPRHEELVQKHHQLVRHIAYRVFRNLPSSQVNVDLEDLVQIGIMGLFEADEKFDHNAGQNFQSFAEFRIRGAMLDELRKRDFFPRRLRAKANRIARTGRQLRAELGREANEEEMATRLEISTSQLRTWRHQTAPYSFIEESDPLIQLKSHTPRADETLQKIELHHQLLDALGSLPERERILLDLYFNQEISQRDIAEIMGLTEGRISQLKSQALRKLRAYMLEQQAQEAC